MRTHRPGDPAGTGDHATLLRRVFWPVVAPAARSRVLPGRTRAHVLRAFGAHVGDGVVVEPGVRVRRPWLLRVDGPAWLAEGARITHRGPVTLERDACVASRARIGGGGRAPITVGAGAWVGTDARVPPGATVGPGTVLTA